MRTLVGACDPDGADPARGFTANLSATYSATYPTPWLSEVRDDTVPLTRTVTTSVASGGNLPLILNLGGSE